jgi:RNA polymerase sigma factor (sigma-70 family)
LKYQLDGQMRHVGDVRRHSPGNPHIGPQKIFRPSAAIESYTQAGAKKKTMSGYPSDRTFWNRVLKMVARHTNGRADPEEILNTAYLRLERYQESRAVKDPVGFLVRTAKNLVVDEYRHAQITARYLSDAQQRERDLDESPLQDEVFAARERLERVKKGLEQLQPRTREIFLMYRLQDMKCRDIALKTGLSESSVEKHIAKAMYFLTKWSEGW